MANPPNRGPAGNKSQAPLRPRAFRIGTQNHEETNYDQTVTLTASTQDMNPFELPPQGYLRGIKILVELDSANT